MVTNNAQKAVNAGLITSANSKLGKAVALYMRPGGATAKQIAAACGGPQRNIITTAKQAGHTVTPGFCKRTGAKTWHLALNSKAKRVVRAKAVQPKAKAKAKRARRTRKQAAGKPQASN